MLLQPPGGPVVGGLVPQDLPLVVAAKSVPQAGVLVQLVGRDVKSLSPDSSPAWLHLQAPDQSRVEELVEKFVARRLVGCSDCHQVIDPDIHLRPGRWGELGRDSQA